MCTYTDCPTGHRVSKNAHFYFTVVFWLQTLSFEVVFTAFSVDQISQNAPSPKMFFSKVAQQRYAGKVNIFIIVVLQITLLYDVPNITEIG